MTIKLRIMISWLADCADMSVYIKITDPLSVTEPRLFDDPASSVFTMLTVLLI